MRIAPVQVWWALKYHSLRLTECDGYITSGALGRWKVIDGHRWRTHPLGFQDLERIGSCQEEPNNLREKFNVYDVLLGSFGREAKLDSIEFIDSIIDVLRSNPRVGFLWTGKKKISRIQERFDSAGVGQQTFFIGWVDTAVWCKVIDIFVDSFPFPSGLTALQAMAAAKPVVLYRSKAALNVGIISYIDSAYTDQTVNPELRKKIMQLFDEKNGGAPLSVANSGIEYITWISRLITDVDIRRSIGIAQQRFALEVMSDTSMMAKGFTDHLLEIVAEKERLVN
jgi:hypothetical protein